MKGVMLKKFSFLYQNNLNISKAYQKYQIRIPIHLESEQYYMSLVPDRVSQTF